MLLCELSVWTTPNLQWMCPALRGGHIPNLKKILSIISEIRTIKVFLQCFLTLAHSTKIMVHVTHKCILVVLLLFAHSTKINVTCKYTLQYGWKFGAIIEGTKANLGIKFGANLINILKAMNNFTYKTKLNFCHTYGLNQLEEQVEN